MTDATVAPFPVVASRAAGHRFGEPVSAPCDAPDRYAQTERTCAICGAVKITVHARGGRHWREWRLKGAAVASERPTDPRCTGDPAL